MQLLFQHQHFVLGDTCRKVGPLVATAIAVYAACQAHLKVATGVVLLPVALLTHDGLVTVVIEDGGRDQWFLSFGEDFIVIFLLVSDVPNPLFRLIAFTGHCFRFDFS
jgi:hypothetical protein